MIERIEMSTSNSPSSYGSCRIFRELTRVLTRSLHIQQRVGDRPERLTRLVLLWPVCSAQWFQNVRLADDSRRPWGYTGVALNPQRGTDLPSPAVPPMSSAPRAAALRRVLRRARDGVALNVDEAAIAMTARGDDLADLCMSAARVRDAGLTSSHRRGSACP